MEVWIIIKSKEMSSQLSSLEIASYTRYTGSIGLLFASVYANTIPVGQLHPCMIVDLIPTLVNLC